MKHELHKCSENDCQVCNGGLALCTICGGAEGSMPTECPGAKMSINMQAAVYADKLDFIGGAWIDLSIDDEDDEL